MAARPNSQRTLEYGRRLAANHLERLAEMVEMTERALRENLLLSPEDVAGYKACLRTAKKQTAKFQQILDIDVPSVNTSTTRRKRGRPSKAELAVLEGARTGKPVRKARKAKATPVAEAPAPKRRGRPKGSKNKTAAEPVVAVKRRGRPPGSKNKSNATEAVAAAPKRRGRPKGSKNKTKAASAAPAANVTKTTRKRGRPKGSKNKPKTVAVAA